MSAKKKEQLNKRELFLIKDRERCVLNVTQALKDVAKFKLGDYLVAYHTEYDEDGDRRTLVVNTYGTPRKYQVVFVDQNGIPYMKELNRSGNVTGCLLTPIRIEGEGRLSVDEYMEFDVDPDYADSIILDDEAGYDASQVHRMKSDLHKEITAHNKSIKVKVNDHKALLEFLKNLKTGDIIWKSIKTHFTIIEMQPIPLTHNGTRLDRSKPFGKAQDSKGRIFDLDADYFRWKAFYTKQPRSYNELKNLK